MHIRQPVAPRASKALLIGVCSVLGVACADDPRGYDVGELQQPLLNGYVEMDSPAVVAMSEEEPGHFFRGHCTGTLIAPNLVLTAAHCVLSTANPFDPSVTCGQDDQLFPSEPEQLLVSADPIRPTAADDPSYFRGVDVRAAPSEGQDSGTGVLATVCGSDVALLVLAVNVPPSVALPMVPRVDTAVDATESFSALGFGVDGLGPEATSGVRMRSDSNSVLCVGEDCAAIDSEVFDREWLTGDARVCPGDSGGPALDALGRVMGVASRGFGACDGVIYGDVSAWGEFIRSTALIAADFGEYEPPGWALGESTEQAALELQESLGQGSFVLPPEASCSLTRWGGVYTGRPLALAALGLGLLVLRRRRGLRPQAQRR